MQIKRILFHPVVIIFVFILFLLFFLSLENTRKKAYEQFIRYKKHEEIIKQKQKELEQLEAEDKKLDSKFYQEKVLRDELLLQKEGERIIQLPPITELPEETIPTPTILKPLQSWWQLLSQ